MAFRTSHRIACGFAALLIAAFASGQAPGGGRGPDTSHVPPPKRAAEPVGAVTLESAVQYRLELLEEDLRLQPDQRAVWLAYRDRVMQLAEDVQRTARTALGGELSASKRLDRVADIARDRLTAIEDIVDAGKKLYASLSPIQQTVADRRMAVPVMALVGVEPSSAALRGGTSKGP